MTAFSPQSQVVGRKMIPLLIRPCPQMKTMLSLYPMNDSAAASGEARVTKRVLILGIGNVLWADEGFGVRCVEAMAETHALPPDVRLLDGGTQGLYLLPFLEQTDALLVFDAIDYGLPPGTMKVVRDAEVPAFMGAKKMSLHQTGFQDVIATSELMGYRPPQMVLIGCQPVELEDYGGGLRPLVAARIPEALRIARDVLAEWGVPVTEGRSDTSLLADPAIRRDAYESGRPDEAAACRIGDDRFFPRLP
jgi:hydrogenase maturation protease